MTRKFTDSERLQINDICKNINQAHENMGKISLSLEQLAEQYHKEEKRFHDHIEKLREVIGEKE